MIAVVQGVSLKDGPLQFDFQATTPCAADVVEAMAPYWSSERGNPSSRQHRLGLTASAAVKLARRQLAEALAVNPDNSSSPAEPPKPTTWPSAMPALSAVAI